MWFQKTPVDELVRMVKQWRLTNPDAQIEDLAQWFFDSFEDCKLAKMSTLRRMAREQLASIDVEIAAER